VKAGWESCSQSTANCLLILSIIILRNLTAGWQSGLLQFFAKESCLKYGDISSNLIPAAKFYLMGSHVPRTGDTRSRREWEGSIPFESTIYGEVAE
jgi:hypothetical protein